MFNIARSAKVHILATGGTVASLRDGSTPDSENTVANYEGLLSDSLGNLMDALNEDDKHNLSFALCHTVWALVSLGVVHGLPMNELWQEYNRAVMTLIDPRSGKVQTDKETGNLVIPKDHKTMNLLEVLVSNGMPYERVEEQKDAASNDEV